ncbi:hypothetical protein [Longispora urticae]
MKSKSIPEKQESTDHALTAFAGGVLPPLCADMEFVDHVTLRRSALVGPDR